MDRFNSHQSIHFSITPLKGIFRNPEKNLFVHLIQNRQWNNEIKNLKPQYFSGRTLEYFYEQSSQFEGGNEFYFFEIIIILEEKIQQLKELFYSLQ